MSFHNDFISFSWNHEFVVKAEASIHQITKDEWLDKLEAAVNQVSEQLTALSTWQGQTLRATSHAKPPRTHRFKDIQCYNCGRKGHFVRNCWNSGNGRGPGIPTR